MKKHIQKLFVFAFALLVPIQSAQANFSISPSTQNVSMRYEATTGQEVIGYALLRNTGNEPKNLKVYANDATKSVKGHFALKPAGSEQVGLGAWTTFEQEIFNLEPRENLEVPFIISIPEGIPPGVYAGGLAVEEAHAANDSSTSGGTSVQITSRVIIPFFVDIAGEKSSQIEFSSLSFSKDPQNKDYFSLGVKNVGNTAILLNPTIHISGFGGLYQKEISESELNLYIGEETNIRMKWEDKPLLGFFTATAKINYFEHDIIQDKILPLGQEKIDINVNIIPWVLITIISMAIAAIVIIITARKAHKKKVLASSKRYTVQPGDTLPIIAKKVGLTWEEIAEINNLQPPYELTPNQYILIPPKK